MQQRTTIGLSDLRESFFLQSRKNEAIDFCLRPMSIFNRGCGTRMYWLKRPECTPSRIDHHFALRRYRRFSGIRPYGAVANPLCDRVDLIASEFAAFGHLQGACLSNS